MTTPPKDAIRERAEECERRLNLIYGDSIARAERIDDIDSALRELAREKDGEIAEQGAKVRQLLLNLTLMHFAGMKVTCCWYSPNVFDRNYSAGAIQGSATCDCQPCTDWRNSKHSKERT